MAAWGVMTVVPRRLDSGTERETIRISLGSGCGASGEIWSARWGLGGSTGGRSAGLL